MSNYRLVPLYTCTYVTHNMFIQFVLHLGSFQNVCILGIFTFLPYFYYPCHLRDPAIVKSGSHWKTGNLPKYCMMIFKTLIKKNNKKNNKKKSLSYHIDQSLLPEIQIYIFYLLLKFIMTAFCSKSRKNVGNI